MSLSLSSLLNPSPKEEESEQAQSEPFSTNDEQPHSSDLRRDSIPPINYVQSPELLHAQLPIYTPPPPRPSAANLNATASHQAVTATAPLAQLNEDAQTGGSNGGHATSATFELPPLPANNQQKLSSPTLDQHQVAPPSHEQRRTSGTSSSGSASPPVKTISSMHTSQVQEGNQSGEVSETAYRAMHSHEEPRDSLSVTIKQEGASPQDTTSSDTRRLSSHTIDQDNQISRTLNTLKHEHTSRTRSPLRESSIALPTTEDASPNTSTMKKRPAPSKKKGTATAKKPRTATKKKRHDAKMPALKDASSKGTPAMSSPAPSDSAMADEYDDEDESMVDSDEDVEGSGDVYCICRKPDNGTFMIGCDGQCDDWFHGKCVGIEERDKNLIDKYICPRCAQAGVGRTSWKRMCRRPGCRLPARVGKNSGKNGAQSKYCSDECGVAFFRQMTGNTRDTEQARKDRANRRKSSAVDHSDLGARGGFLSTGEIRAALDQSNTAEEFKEFGNGVLSPPATPSADRNDLDDGMSELEQEAINKISAQKEQARQRHQLLKDRLKFIILVKNEVTRAATAKDLKPKEYCGFDARLEWTEEEFAEWRQSHQGQQAFERETLEVPADQTNGVDHEATMADAINVEEYEVCSRKKCARHHEWSKLTTDDVRFEMTDNSDNMRSLEQQEHDIKERASIRAKARKFGDNDNHVEIHEIRPAHAGVQEIKPADGERSNDTVQAASDAVISTEG